MSAGAKPLCVPLALLLGLLQVWVGPRATRPHAADFPGKTFDDVLAELSVLRHVFTFEAELVGLVHIAAAHGADLVENVQKGGLSCLCPGQAMLGRVAHIASGNVGGAVGRKGNAVTELLLPACSQMSQCMCVVEKPTWNVP